MADGDKIQPADGNNPPEKIDTAALAEKWKRDQEEYAAERTRLCTVYADGEKTYDQNLIYLSAGALGLSMAFIKDIAQKPPVHPYFLFGAWIALGVSLAVILINSRIAPGLHWEFLEILNRHFAPGKYDVSNDTWVAIHLDQSNVKFELSKITFGIVKKKVCFLKLMDGLNRTSVIAFFVGAILLGIFIFSNMGTTAVATTKNDLIGLQTRSAKPVLSPATEQPNRMIFETAKPVMVSQQSQLPISPQTQPQPQSQPTK